jgi:phage tail sheath gpL-like
MFKFLTIGAFKSVLNNPRARAIAAVKPGYVGAITDNYSASGSKSSVAILVAGTTPADGVITFDIGGQTVYTTITGATQDTAAKVATLLKSNLDAVLLGLGYTVAIDTATITVTAPANGASILPVTLQAISMGTSACTLTPTYTAGTDAVTYPEAFGAIATDTAAKSSELWVCMNINDKPEIWDSSTFTISAGEYVNSFKLNDLKGMEVK